jgi:hypothetical protein
MLVSEFSVLTFSYWLGFQILYLREQNLVCRVATRSKRQLLCVYAAVRIE